MIRAAVTVALVVVVGVGAGLLLRDSGKDTGPVLDWATTPRLDVPDPLAGTEQARALALALQPTVSVQVKDGFWPVSVLTVFRERTRAQHGVCLGKAGYRERRRGCKIVGDPRELPWEGGDAEAFIDYAPPSRDAEDQRRAAVAALGLPRGRSTPVSEQRRTARVYFYVTPGSAGTVGVQYWFFYAYNYEPFRVAGQTVFTAGLHEGDFEQMSVLVSRDGRPVYVWLARHCCEGHRFTWEEGALQREAADSTHLRVYAARGSHALFESCGRKKRATAEQLPALGVIDDSVDCGETIDFSPETPLINLAMTSWACWHGRFGFSPHLRNSLKYEFSDGPSSPLDQQRRRGRVNPCAGAPAPLAHTAEREEAPGAATPFHLQRQGGDLMFLFDSCPKWDQLPAGPTSGYVVACDDGLLHRFTASGLTGDDVTRATCLRLVTPEHGDCRDAVAPAVYHATHAAQLDGLRLTADQPVTPRVFAAVRDHGRLFQAVFDAVALRPGRRLRLDRRRTPWTLVDDGTARTVAVADMRKTRVVDEPPSPGDVEAVRRGDDIAVSFVAPPDRTVGYRVTAASSAAELNDSGLPVRQLRFGAAGHDERRLGKKRIRYSVTLPGAGAAFVRVVALRDGVSHSMTAPVRP